MMYDVYLLKDLLIKMIDQDKKRYPASYEFEFGDGVNFVLDCLTNITGISFTMANN